MTRDEMQRALRVTALGLLAAELALALGMRACGLI